MWKKLMLTTILVFYGTNVLADSCPNASDFIKVKRGALGYYWNLRPELLAQWRVHSNETDTWSMTPYYQAKEFSSAMSLDVMVVPGDYISNVASWQYALVDSSVMCVYGKDLFPEKGIITLVQNKSDLTQKINRENFKPSSLVPHAYVCNTPAGEPDGCKW